MILKKLKIKDFCNYKNIDLEFNPASNVFFGDNGTGKTNLLEAIYFLAFLRSQRACKDGELIHWGKQGFYLRGEVERKGNFFHCIEISLYREGNKKLRINSKVRMKLPPAEEGLKIVGFYPDDSLLISATPLSRRRFLNLEISQIDGVYRSYLRQYQGILTQRNLALKRVRSKKGFLDDLLPWDEQVVRVGARIIEKRLSLIEEICPIARKIHGFLTGGREDLTIGYVNSSMGEGFRYGSSNTSERSNLGLADKFSQSVCRLREREVSMGMTLVGPHRDDITFFINNINASIFGSHAQKRTIVISLKLALAELLEKILGEPPAILLDDVLSELDEKRRDMLLDFLQSHKMQCFITGTNAEQFRSNLKKATFFEVSGGTIAPQTIG